jgi:hypothetical protein
MSVLKPPRYGMALNLKSEPVPYFSRLQAAGAMVVRLGTTCGQEDAFFITN